MYKIVMEKATSERGTGKSWKFSLEILKPLDYEKERIFQLTMLVKVREKERWFFTCILPFLNFLVDFQDGPLLNNTADFTLTVLDSSDNQPVFMKQPYDRKIAENSKEVTMHD